MKYFAVIDTNVFVSALLAKHADSPTVVIVEKLFSDVVIPVFSQKILDEYSEVLKREKFFFDPKTVSILFAEFGNSFDVCNPRHYRQFYLYFCSI